MPLVGQVYRSERATLIQGDCLEVLRDLPDASVDAVVTDPPYFLPAKHYNTRKEFPRSLSDLSILEHFFRDFFTECVRVLKPTGCLYTFCDGQSYPVFFVTAYRYFRRLAPLVWDKMTSINGYSWRHQHELILYAEMNRAPLVPTGDGDIIRCRAVPVNSRMHPAEKPVELLQRLVEKSTVSIAMVLDPFMGSGATGVAAVQTGRKFIGVEISEEYCTIARERLAKAEGVKVCH